MNFWSKRRISIAISVIIGVSIIGWQIFVNNATNNMGLKESRASSEMNYDRFLEYLDKDWIKTVDFYDNDKIAVIKALSPELGDRSQKTFVEIPLDVSPLIIKLREAKIDFTAHSSPNYDFLFTLLGYFFIPFLILLGLFYLSRRVTDFLDNINEDFGKAPIKVQVDTKIGIAFNDIAGIDEAKEEFEEIVTFLKKPQRFTSVGAKIPKGVILVGPPGTGKTLLAKAIAGEAGVPFISIAGSEFVEIYVGVGASRARDLFMTAKQNAPCIVFIDEIDAVGRRRGAGGGFGGGNDEREQTLNQILTEMDGFQENTGVIVIAATNRVDILDAALLRPGRFDRQVDVNLPDVKGRFEILKVHAKNKKINDDVSLDSIAQRTSGFSGADLANLLNEAAIITARRNKLGITIDEVNTAIDRIIVGLEGTPFTDTKNKRLIAYHEIGHAITGTLLKYHDDVQKITLIPRGQARGLTWFTPNEDQSLISRGQLVAIITGMLGGRAAEEVVFGLSEITTNASNDLQQVTNLARQMVTRYGMSTVGPISLDSGGGQVFLGGSFKNGSELSSTLADKVDDQVKVIVTHCYIQAIDIIKKNRVVMDQLVDRLIQEETIEGDEFRKYVASYTKLPEKFIVSSKN